MSLKFWGKPSYMWERFKHTIKWIPFMWKNDYDWDHTSELEILRFKLKSKIKSFTKWSRHTCWEDDVAQMQFVVNILDRILDHNCYYDLATSNLRSLSPGDAWTTKPAGKNLTELVDIRDEKRKKQDSRYYDHVRYLEEQDWKLLWRHLEKYMRNWWD